VEQKRREAGWTFSCQPEMVKDLILVMWGARYFNAAGLRDRSTLMVTSINADLDRSRYVIVRSRSGLDMNWKQVQRDGLDMRAERQYRQTCVAVTRTNSYVRNSKTFDRISGGSLLTGKRAFLIDPAARKISDRSRSMSIICEP